MRLFLYVSISIILLSCAAKPPAPVKVTYNPDIKINYLKEVKPILDKRCVSCHSCYNSPCQLKMSSYEGVARGGSKIPVYSGSRLRAQDPTRLFIDAKSTEEWHKNGFFSVTDNSAGQGLNNSILMHLIDHKMKNPVSEGDYFPEATDLTCSANSTEVGKYLKKHPNQGMPFGFPALTEKEFNVIAAWLQSGAKGPDEIEDKRLKRPSALAQVEIDKWETFLNADTPKFIMTARYLYEHLFLAHINFNNNPKEFYELVRSKTPPGEPVDVIDTIRPYDDPGTDSFYYRFVKIHSTIVHKTHMVFKLNDQKLDRIRSQFIEPKWMSDPYVVEYDTKISANPFAAFEQIPPMARYQFLLDNSHYIIMTFIRGPVCKGQIALNVIHDHFWVMFMDPKYDLSVRFPGFIKNHQSDLEMPIEKGSNIKIWKSFSDDYNEKAVRYLKDRDKFYSSIYAEGLGVDSIWKGNTADDAPMLTVYRHFDSASVHKGVLGGLPRTMWVIDYPLLERIYYSLVAGFDVYGNVGHQANIRRYMNNLRINGEGNFINYMPSESRFDFITDWYQGLNKKTFADVEISNIPTKVTFETKNYKKEFIEKVVNEQILPETGIQFDQLNYDESGMKFQLPTKYTTPQDYIDAFRSLSDKGAAFVKNLNDYSSNLAYLRIKIPNKPDHVMSIVINRWHDNVAFMFNESGRLNPEKDSADFIPGFIGSYPNSFLEVHQRELPDFFRLLKHFDSSEADIKKLNRYVVNRADENFWESFDWFQKRFYQDDPMNAGLFDLNRYYHKADVKMK